MTYDALVIGTGPAGCTAAKNLAENSYTVLLTEKFTLPNEKFYPDMLIKKTIVFYFSIFRSGARSCDVPSA